MTIPLPRLPTAQECALLLLRLLEVRDGQSPVSRVRLSDLTLRRLFGRNRLGPELLEEVQEWLARGGWTLFSAGSTYAAVRVGAVTSWSRVSSKRMADELKNVRDGSFDFNTLGYLLGTDDLPDD